MQVTIHLQGLWRAIVQAQSEKDDSYMVDSVGTQVNGRVTDAAEKGHHSIIGSSD